MYNHVRCGRFYLSRCQCPKYQCNILVWTRHEPRCTEEVKVVKPLEITRPGFIITNKVQKECAGEISLPLVHIFNCSLETGIFPSSWKSGAVTPVFKCKGSRSDPKSYRPITLLPCLSKIFESFVRDQLQSHCLLNGALPDEQFGFLPKRSTVWQLLSIVDDWENALDKGETVHSCFLDMAKAFDKVNHSLLLLKLCSVGVKSTELAWFKSYLTGRSICTAVEGVHSAAKYISSGVPQGSVLGPLLFIIFYRDLPSITSSETAMFADDTQLHDRCTFFSTGLCTCKVQDDLRTISEWAKCWDTTFNAAKSSHMLLTLRKGRSRDPSRPVLTLDSVLVPLVEHTRHLGVILTSNLSWSDHVNSLLQRQRFNIFLLKRLAQRRNSSEVVKKLYIGLVRPAFEYASAVWDNCTQQDRLALERAQLSIARSILRCPRRTSHSWEVLKKIDWPTLAWRRCRYKLMLLWDLLHGRGPPNLVKHIPKPVSDRCNFALRNACSIETPLCRTSHRSSSFLPASIALLNSLPLSVLSCTSRSMFFTELNKHFSHDKFTFGLT